MGNEDSGRWRSSDAKTTVEDCAYIDILAWSRRRQMRHGCCYTGSWKWPRSRPEEVLDRTGRVINCIHYSIELLGDPFVRMCYKDLRNGGFYDDRQAAAVQFFESGKIDTRIAHGVLAEGAMARQRVVPAKEYQPRLHIRTEQAIQHSGDHERKPHRDEVLRVREGGRAGRHEMALARPEAE